jgi:DNA-binding response OmpR family regulator
MSRAARILIAEEHGAVARPLIAHLKSRGHTVRWVRAVREIRAELPQLNPDILVIDVGLDTDGLEYFQAIRFTPQCPPGGVVVLIEPGDTHSRDRANQLGAAGVLAKPVDESRLTGLIEELMAFV